MSFIKTIPVSQAENDVRELYQRQQGPYGYVPNYAKVFCYRPDVMKAWAKLQVSIRQNIDSKEYELTTLAAAQAMSSSYCSLAHGRVLNETFYGDEDIAAIAQGGGESVLSERERAIMALARKVVIDSSSVTQQDIDDLKQCGLDDAEIFDVIASAAARCFFAKLADGLGALPDSVFTEMDEVLREALLVGRPISTEQPETIT
ncbi:MAG: peroxidase-related enzyme [Pseudomonadales bacterium]